MLVLTRGKYEEIVIGDNIVVTMVEVQQDGRVRIGIDAPKDIPVHRREVYDKIQGGTPPPAEGDGDKNAVSLRNTSKS